MGNVQEEEMHAEACQHIAQVLKESSTALSVSEQEELARKQHENQPVPPPQVSQLNLTHLIDLCHKNQTWQSAESVQTKAWNLTTNSPAAEKSIQRRIIEEYYRVRREQQG